MKLLKLTHLKLNQLGCVVVMVCCVFDVLAQTSRAVRTPAAAAVHKTTSPNPPPNSHLDLGGVDAITLDSIKLLALSATDGTAVLVFQTKKTTTVRVGETIPGTLAVVTQVLPDKIILDDARSATLGRQIIWMHKSNGASSSKIERFSSMAVPAFDQQPPKISKIALSKEDSDGKISSQKQSSQK